MEFDFGGAFLFVQIINLLILFGWLIAALHALFRLRGMRMPATARALWTLIILLIPFIGAIAFFLVCPGDETNG
ncbi:MAG: PLDc N-terminal domain-containing protein [Anaerolineae bacterium]